jgi:hypothetical protein
MTKNEDGDKNEDDDKTVRHKTDEAIPTNRSAQNHEDTYQCNSLRREVMWSLFLVLKMSRAAEFITP